MLKKIMRLIRRQQLKHKKQRHHSRWELIMRGMAVRDHETEKPNEIRVDYGRVMGHVGVTPVYIDSTNWSVMK